MDTVYQTLIYTAYPLPNTLYLSLDQKDKFFYVLIPFNFRDMDLPPRDQRHQYLRFEGLEYTNDDIADFEERLGKIYSRGVHRVQVYDFSGLTTKMAEGLSGRMLMEHTDAQRQSVFTSHAWRRLFEAGYRLIACNIAGRSQAPEKVTMTYLFYLRGMDVGSVNIPYLLAWYLRRFSSGRKCGAMIFRGQFVARLADHFGLLAEQRLHGLTVIVAPGPERQPDATAGAPKVAEGTLDVDEGAQAVPSIVQAPQPPTSAQGFCIRRIQDLAGKKSTTLVEYP
ncbi:hypothetical protein Tco_0090528 [Tanacetum coccineum]